MKVALPLVTASGKREGWWMHVTGVAAGNKQGFGGFIGSQLSSGECDLPPLAVVLLVRPSGAAKSSDRKADVMYVSPSGGELQGRAYGFDWGIGSSFAQLKLAVASALDAQARFNATEKKLQGILSKWVGSANTGEAMRGICAEVAGVVKDCVPLADDITVEPSKEHRDQVIVTFSAHGVAQGDRLIRCAVPGYNSMGDPDFCYLMVQVPATYEFVDEDDEAEALHHYRVARAAAAELGYEVASMVPVYDDFGGEWNPLMELFEWSSASVFGLDGKEIE